MQIDLVVHQSIFLRLTLFRMCSRDEILLLIHYLRPGMALPGEALVRQGEFGVGLFFLMKGAVKVLQNDKIIVVVYAIAAFGESALYPHARPVATVRAVRFCELTLLRRADFQKVASTNPQIMRYLQQYTQSRDAAMKQRFAAEQRRVAALRKSYVSSAGMPISLHVSGSMADSSESKALGRWRSAIASVKRRTSRVSVDRMGFSVDKSRAASIVTPANPARVMMSQTGGTASVQEEETDTNEDTKTDG